VNMEQGRSILDKLVELGREFVIRCFALTYNYKDTANMIRHNDAFTHLENGAFKGACCCYFSFLITIRVISSKIGALPMN